MRAGSWMHGTFAKIANQITRSYHTVRNPWTSQNGRRGSRLAREIAGSIICNDRKGQKLIRIQPKYIMFFCIIVFGEAKAVITRLESFISRATLSWTWILVCTLLWARQRIWYCYNISKGLIKLLSEYNQITQRHDNERIQFIYLIPTMCIRWLFLTN